jgi:hypothetical protein
MQQTGQINAHLHRSPIHVSVVAFQRLQLADELEERSKVQEGE